MFLKRLLKFWNKEEENTRKIQDMTYFMEKEEFVDYPLCWQECSCSGRNDLIHYLNSNEEIFRGIVNIEFNKRITGEITDILSIDGISSSRSPVDKYTDLNEFALSLTKNAKTIFNDKTAIEFLTDQDFVDNCNFIKREYHKLHGIAVQGWNNKKYILNSNCSHHLAAVYRQCKEQGRKYQLSLDIVPETIDTKKLNQLLNQYYLIFTDSSNINKLDDKYDKMFQCESVNMHDYYRYGDQSFLFPLKKGIEFNRFVVELLKECKGKFLILNDELERRYL